MRIITMRSVAGEAPAIIAEVLAGETAQVGTTVEGGSGVVTLIGPPGPATLANPNPGPRAAISAVEMFAPEQFAMSVQPADWPEDGDPFVPVPVSLGPPEPLGYTLARRIRDGLLTFTIDGGS